MCIWEHSVRWPVRYTHCSRRRPGPEEASQRARPEPEAEIVPRQLHSIFFVYRRTRAPGMWHSRNAHASQSTLRREKSPPRKRRNTKCFLCARIKEHFSLRRQNNDSLLEKQKRITKKKTIPLESQALVKLAAGYPQPAKFECSSESPEEEI